MGERKETCSNLLARIHAAGRIADCYKHWIAQEVNQMSMFKY